MSHSKTVHQSSTSNVFIQKYSNRCDVVEKNKTQKHVTPLHLLVVLSRMAFVDTILPYLGEERKGLFRDC